MAQNKSKFIGLSWPMAGVNKKLGYQSQAPYSTPSALNVRPTDQITMRRRGGSRPGTIKALNTQLGSGNPINMLNAVTTVGANGVTFWADYFDQPTLAPYWIATGGNAPSILPDNISSITYGNTAGVVRTTAPANFQTSSGYVVEAFLVPFNGSFGGDYELYLGCPSNAPYTNGYVFRLQMQDDSGDYQGSAYRYTGGVIQESYLFTNGSTGAAQPGWFSVFVNGVSISVAWNGVTILTQTFGAAPTSTGIGFGGEATQDGGALLFDTFRLQHSPSNGNVAYRRRLVAASNGTLYAGAYENTMSAVSSNLTLNTDRILQSSERLQKLYIADNGTKKASGTNGVVTSGVLDSASYTDWSTVGIDTDDDVCEVTNVVGATGGFRFGTYAITSVHATNGLTLTGASGSCTSCSFRIMRGAKVHTPSAATLTLMLASTDSLTSLVNGAVPVGCTMVTTYKDRLVWAGDPDAPHAFFASRKGDPLDYDYGRDGSDEGRAVGGTQSNTPTGGISEPIKALINYSSDNLIFGCTNSIYRLRGDWASGGNVEILSRVTGVVGRFAHCCTPEGDIVFLGRDGLYAMPKGGGEPVPISRDRLPDELTRLDSEIYDINLEFDVENRGIHIFISQNESTSTFGTGQYNWWLDWETKGFWPFQLPSAQQPRCTMYTPGNSAEDNCVLLGCRDGYIRRFHRYAENDDGTTFSSHCVIGPINMGDGYSEGLWAEQYATVAQRSGDVGYALYRGDNHEEAAIASTAFYSGTWTSNGLNYKTHPRMRGMSGILKLSNGETGRWWSIETLGARIDRVGVQRK